MKSFFFIVFCLFASSVSATESLDLALDLFKTKAYRKDAVNWDMVEENARKILKEKGESEAIEYLVTKLGDPHTSYRPKNVTKEPKKDPPSEKVSEIAAISQPTSSVPILQINSWMGKDQLEASIKVRDALTSATQLNSCGLVLDFSSNQGGNMWPMVLGLAPLLDRGKLAAFVDAENNRTIIEKINGAIYIGGKPHFLNYKLPVSDLDKPRAVAIVVGPLTASSGEITPMLFLGQDNVRFFGSRTAGYTSANRVFQLPNEGRLVLTTSQTEDRSGNVHAQGIEPNDQSDSPFQAAASWVMEQCSSIPN